MRKKLVPLAMFCALILFFLVHLGARITAVPVFTFADDGKTVYLTFDDGPSTVVTGRVLDILQKEGVKATFFVVSDRVAGREETLKRIAAEGHTLGVHSKTHVYGDIYASDEALLSDAEACADVIRKVAGVQPHVYRFPGGGSKRREEQTKLLEARGYRVVRWNAVCGDEEIPRADADTLVSTAIETSRGKNCVVLLLHDSAHHSATAEALPRIIAHFRGLGYDFRAF